MKKSIIAALMLSAAASSYSCEIAEAVPDSLYHLIHQEGGYPISDQKCALIKKSGFAIKVVGQVGVGSGVSFGWVVVSLVSENQVGSIAARTQTRLDSSVVSTARANQLFMLALKEAISSWDVSKSIKEVEQAEAALKARR